MMEVDVGIRDFPLWLIGDSDPTPWRPRLTTPLDPRHPVRHSIWTAVLEVIQDRLYRSAGLRLDDSVVYIRNAVSDPGLKPHQSEKRWTPETDAALSELRALIRVHRPVMLFTFGAFAFEFVRRAVGEPEMHPYGHWAAGRLGEEFRFRIRDFEPGTINVIPLLHRSVTGRFYLESQEYFCAQDGANYFETVGLALADTLLRFRNQLPIWVGFESSIPSASARAESWR